MKCAQAQEWMSEKLDGALESSRSEKLEQHLQGCPHCQQEWSALAESWAMLGSLPELSPSPLFRARVWEKIRHDSPPTPVWSLKRWLSGLGLSLAGLMLCLKLTAPAPLASPTLPPPTPALAPQTLAAAELQEWDTSVEVMPGLDTVAEEDSPVASLPLGDLSHDYFAMDETLEEF
ncbi:MAG: zf-HC2 domain-containing protein [Vulcanimicrobiota bacterium]